MVESGLTPTSESISHVISAASFATRYTELGVAGATAKTQRNTGFWDMALRSKTRSRCSGEVMLGDGDYE